MNIIGSDIFIIQIIARLSPREYAQMRVLNKKICADISRKYAQILWRHKSYENFCFMLLPWEPKHVKQAAKWFWNIDQFIKLNYLYFNHRIDRCLEVNLFGGWNGWSSRYTVIDTLTINFVFALLENLCTFEEVLQCNAGVIGTGFQRGTILNLLRKRKYDVMGYFKKFSHQNIEKWEDAFRFQEGLPFDLEEVLEYCISKWVDIPKILIKNKRVGWYIKKGIWNWKEVLDYCVHGSENMISDIAESSLLNMMNFKDVVEAHIKDVYEAGIRFLE
jgi:hypothetical protein